ncbi:MAG: hypothetical protein HY775_03805 [Acidobacteria bacterium]|nr:hypothetical protein [Acidobacteriota bacterium]
MAEIEFLILADHAEAVGGKLYLTGAGWTDSWRGPQPEGQPLPITHFGIAVSVLVAWTETNRPQHLRMRIENEDGTTQHATVEGDIEVGRPPGLPPGSDQRAVLAVNANVQFPSPGGYRIVAEVGEGVRTVSFRVHDAPTPART